MLLLWNLLLFDFVFVFAILYCGLVIICWKRADLLALLRVIFSCIFTFPLMSQLRRSKSIADLCLLPYFVYK